MKHNQTPQNIQLWNGKLPITEIFRSIQGEGSLVGTPSIFVRTNFCNLRCWFCDTPYTSHEPEKADKMTTRQIIGRVETLAHQESEGWRGGFVGYIVITGGEPMMWHEPLLELVEALRERSFHVTIETNGTIFQPVSEFCLMSVSPKLASSAPRYENKRKQDKWETRHNATRIDMDILRQFVDDGLNYQLKFVITSRTDMDEVLPLLDDLNANRNKVYLMPEGRLREHVKVNAEMVWDLAIKYGLRYSPRLQVDLFDDKRGV